MYYGEIKNCDIANGVGVRVSIFVSGCRYMCKNCFLPQTWDFEYGKPFTKDTEEYILGLLKNSYIKGLTVLGGEPFEPSNQEGLYPFLKRVRSELPNKNIWIFTGFTYEELLSEDCRANCEHTQKILELTDVLVDGRYKEEEKNISLKFRGSENQRIIDVQKTILKNEVVLYDL